MRLLMLVLTMAVSYTTNASPCLKQVSRVAWEEAILNINLQDSSVGTSIKLDSISSPKAALNVGYYRVDVTFNVVSADGVSSSLIFPIAYSSSGCVAHVTKN